MIPLEKPLTPAEQDLAVALLVQARVLNNQTVQDAREVDNWHRYTDAFLYDKPGDDPKERWDAPARAGHRDFLARMFGWGKYARAPRPGRRPSSRDELGR